MIEVRPRQSFEPPALMRLSALASLNEAAVAALQEAMAQAQPLRARRELFIEGSEIRGTQLIVDGWVAHVRHLADGRRQFLSFLLPGDLIGLCDHHRPLAVSTVVALTDALICPAPAAKLSPSLANAYAASRAFEQAYLLAQITRLGRFTAEERIADLLLELLERLELAGLAHGGAFDMPLTQEIFADALGLTPVHVNRMLQLLRRDDIRWSGGRLKIVDPAVLAARIGRGPTRVSQDMAASLSRSWAPR